MIPHGPLHGREDVAAVVALQQQQHALGLVFAATLFLQQAVQEADGHFAQFGVPLAEQFELRALIAGRPMVRIDPPLAALTDQQQMLSHLLNLVVVKEQFGFRDPRRQ